MKNIIYMGLILFSISAYSQTYDSIYEKKGFEFFEKNNFDSSLFYVNKIKRRNTAYYLLKGVNYQKKDRLEDAKSHLLRAFIYPISFHNSAFSLQSTQLLGAIYFEEKNYKESLKYFKVLFESYSVKSYDINVEDYFVSSYCLSQCYAFLNKQDSAILVLTPTMFLDAFDSTPEVINEYREAQDFYLELLYERYTQRKLKNYLEKSLNNMDYERFYLVFPKVGIDTTIVENRTAVLVDSILEEKEERFLSYSYHILCSVTFLGASVTFQESYHADTEDSYESTPLEYKKLGIQNQFKKNYIYNQIMME